MKICLVCSHGGHLYEMMRLLDAFKEHKYFFVTYTTEIVTYDTGTIKDLKKTYFIKWGGRGMLIKILIKAVKILINERPDVIVSTGGGRIAIVFCYVGKLLGAKVIFIESLAMIETPSMGGKLVYPIADLFLVQWESLLKKYGKKAKYWGKVI